MHESLDSESGRVVDIERCQFCIQMLLNYAGADVATNLSEEDSSEPLVPMYFYDGHHNGVTVRVEDTDTEDPDESGYYVRVKHDIEEHGQDSEFFLLMHKQRESWQVELELLDVSETVVDDDQVVKDLATQLQETLDSEAQKLWSPPEPL